MKKKNLSKIVSLNSSHTVLNQPPNESTCTHSLYTSLLSFVIQEIANGVRNVSVLETWSHHYREVIDQEGASFTNGMKPNGLSDSSKEKETEAAEPGGKREYEYQTLLDSCLFSAS
jgi:hypothetical protein